MNPPWDLSPSATIQRKALHDRFGGRRQGGIGPSATTSNVFVFFDAESGAKHGYYDVWMTDGCFHYTGEGQYGDQVMKSGNAAILNHRRDERVLRVFEGTGGLVTYVDEFEIDTTEPYYRTEAQETGSGEIREVIVFRLRPKHLEPPEATSKIAAVLAGPANVQVPIERQHTEKAYVAPSQTPYEAERREQKLVLELESHLQMLGHGVTRNQLVPTGEARPLLTDLYDVTLDMLVEAKGSVARNEIRMAIGQLADYRRFFGDGHPQHLAVLVPREPRRDLCDLLAGEGIDVIFKTEHGFDDSTGGALVGQ